MKLKMAGFLGVVFAVIVHGGVLLFGGILFPKATADHSSLQVVELLSDEDIAEKAEEKIEEKVEELEAESEEIPDAEKIIQSLEMPTPYEAPALDAASLSAIEAALNGLAGAAGDFSMGANLEGGGVIGGTGRPGSLGDQMDEAFSLAEIDQKPRPVFQGAPVFPSEMRGKKFEGVVTVIFVVDPSGKVSNPRIEKSNHAAFEKPAMDAIRKWKFEPGIKAGQRVACRSRVDIRFPAN